MGGRFVLTMLPDTYIIDHLFGVEVYLPHYSKLIWVLFILHLVQAEEPRSGLPAVSSRISYQASYSG